MKNFRVIVKRHIVLSTVLMLDAQDNQDAGDYATTLIQNGELGSVESWIEECPHEWKIEEQKDSVESTEEFLCG